MKGNILKKITNPRVKTNLSIINRTLIHQNKYIKKSLM